MKPVPQSRRHWLVRGAGALVGAAGLSAAARRSDAAAPPAAPVVARSHHFPFGPVAPPRPVGAWPVTTHQGRPGDLRALLTGHATAVQLMFAGCSAVCPIQGALFAQAQDLYDRQPFDAPGSPVQFLSITIDPLADDPAALAAWLRRFDAGPRWRAVVPRVQDVDAIVSVFGEGGEARPAGRDPHTGQVFVVDRRGALVFRTPSLPSAQSIVAALRQVVRAAQPAQ